RDEQRAREVVDGIVARDGKACYVLGDIGTFATSQALVATAVREYGGLDILVPNAGILGIGSITDVPMEIWHETVNTNLNAVFYLLRAGIPELQKRGRGTIVVNGSIAAYKGFPNHPAYCASKGALVPLVK